MPHLTGTAKRLFLSLAKRDLDAVGRFEIKLRSAGYFETATLVNHLTCDLERKLAAYEHSA